VFPVHELVTMSRPGQIAHLARCRSTKSAAQSAPPPCGLPPFNWRRQRPRGRSRRPVERPCPGEQCGRGIRRAGPRRFHLETANLGLARGFRFRRHRARRPRAGLWIAGCRSFTGTLMLTAESRLGHLLPTDRSEATPRLPATAEADQPNSATAVSTTPQRDREARIGQSLGTRQGSSGRR
jgi:hypothetical protein